MKIRKILACGIALYTACNVATFGVFADTQTVNYDSSVDESATVRQDVGVEVERAATYAVTLPKSVVLDATKEVPDYEYDVTVSGEISSANYVRVIPLDGATVTNGNSVLDLQITQDKRRFDSTEVASSTTVQGTMSVAGMEPGLYVGNVEFLITMDDGGYYKAATCTSPMLRIGNDDNDDGVLQEEEKLGTPIKIGKPLGHKFADGCVDFPATCERCGKLVYAISTPEQLTAFRDSVNAGNAYAGATIELNADIDMSGVTWDYGIGKYDTYTNKPFRGNFNGNGYTIKNLTMVNNDLDGDRMTCYGFFGYIDSASVIQNFTLYNPSIKHYSYYSGSKDPSRYIGIVCGYVLNAPVTINNVHIVGGSLQSYAIRANGLGYFIGGFIGCASGNTVQVKNCSLLGTTLCTTGTRYAATISGVLGCFNSASTAIVENTLVDGILTDVGSATLSSVGVKYYAATGTVTANNCVVTDAYSTGATTETNVVKLSTEDCKTQTAVDVLNTDNTNFTWKLDLEDLNMGYPICESN